MQHSSALAYRSSGVNVSTHHQPASTSAGAAPMGGYHSDPHNGTATPMSSLSHHHHHQHHQHAVGTVGAPIDVSGALAAAASNSAGANAANAGPIVLFDAEVPVHVKQLEREEVYQPLGVCVSVGRGGPSGVSKCVTVRLTDPKDPFFLFSMTLLEDDYGRFKERHELMVDFNGFPRDLVHMVSGIGSGVGSNVMTFVADSKDSCVLRILERTEFRALEHIALNMSRQGDVGQKKYLAEKFQHFLAAFNRSEHERKEEVMAYERLLAECREDIRRLTSERDELSDRTRTDATLATSNQIAALSALKDQHAAELKQLQSAMDDLRGSLSAKLEASSAHHTNELRQKEAEVAQLRSQLDTATSNNANLSTQLRMAKDSVANLTTEVEQLRKDHESLTAYRTSATQRITEQELAHATNTERIRHLTETLKGREEDIRALREAQGSQDGYAKMLAGQLSTLQEKLQTSEASLAKAHHVLASQVQAMRAAKDKNNALRGQCEANEMLLGEKNNAIERLQGELSNQSDRVEMLQGKVTGLKDQLMKSEEQVSKLTIQLKQNEDALVHMQRMSSGFGARTFGAGGPLSGVASAHGSTLNLTGGASTLGGGQPFSGSNLYRQFASGTNLVGGGMGGITASLPLPGAGTTASSAAASPMMVQSGASSVAGGNSPTTQSAGQPVPTTAATTGLGTAAGSSGANGGGGPQGGAGSGITATNITANNHLLQSGYNPMASGVAVLANRANAAGMPPISATSGALGPHSTYPYTASSPLRTPLGTTGGNTTAGSVAYLPPKGVMGTNAYTERPSSYFGGN